MQSSMKMNAQVNYMMEVHGNISWNGYENVIIDRYGGCFEEGIISLWTGESCAARERLAIIEG